jgi:hypothetical protein
MKVAFLILVIPCLTFALVAGPHRIIGKVRSLEEKTVTIDSDQYEYILPRDLGDKKKLKVGSEIEVLLSEDQISKVKATKKTTRK